MTKQLCLSLQLNLISFIFANEKAKNVALCKPEASCKLLIVQEIIIYLNYLNYGQPITSIFI